METASSDYVCIDPENPETVVHHPTISDRNVPSISQIDISHRDFDYPEDLHCRLFMDIHKLKTFAPWYFVIKIVLTYCWKKLF